MKTTSKAKILKAHTKKHGLKVLDAKVAKNADVAADWKGIPQAVSGRIKWVEGSK